jgi:hypothetical protein
VIDPSIVAVCSAKLTLASDTPATPLSAFSTVETQPAQLIPEIDRRTVVDMAETLVRP